MAAWTDKDTFRLVHVTWETYFHVLQPGVLNERKQYSSGGDIRPINTNGEVILNWWSSDAIPAQPVTRTELAEMIRRTKPDENLPLLVVSIPDIERLDIGRVGYCWIHINAAKTMQLYLTDNSTVTARTYAIPNANNNIVDDLCNSVISRFGTPRIYYDWREALTPITNYFKAVIKYCKDTGRIRRLETEAANKALADRNEAIRALVSKNNKRFKNIEF